MTRPPLENVPVPTAVLADLLGLHPWTATTWTRDAAGDWTRAAAGDWSRYAARG